jgi:chemotaxis protein CheC
MPFLKNFNATHIDILKEVGNIGAGHAATALSTLLEKKIDMKVPDVKIVSFNEMMELVDGTDSVVVSVFLRVEGAAPGSMFYILSIDQASRFIQQLTKDPTFSFEKQPYPEMALSALQELGNILLGSYLSAFSDFTRLTMYPSVPAISIDMVGAIISYGLMELSTVGDHAILINTALQEENQSLGNRVEGHLFLLPDPDSFSIIFNALGVADDEE